jgi:LPXTG-motif cell wall-anchored protein
MTMGAWLGAVAAAATLALGGTGPASAADRREAAACSPAGTSLALTAQGYKFDEDCLAIPAGETFTIRFDNRDQDRHNVSILPSHTAPDALFQGDILPGPKSSLYGGPKLKPGTYHFHCDVHPNLMNGTFVVADGRAPATGASPAPDRAAAEADSGAPATGSRPAANAPLPRTGPTSGRPLLLLAGLALAAGGLAVLGGARRATA